MAGKAGSPECDEMLNGLSYLRWQPGPRPRRLLRCVPASSWGARRAWRTKRHPQTVGKWRRRFLAQRLEDLRDDPRLEAARTIEDKRVEAVITRTLESKPEAATHWSSRGMARDSGLSVSTVQARLRAEAASAGDVQALHRSRLRGQGARCGGVVCFPS